MTLPEVPKDSLSPSRWADRVRRDEPHGLDTLEARVLAYATEADELSKTSNWRIAWNVAPLFFSVLASIGGFAALVGNQRHIRRGWTTEPDMTAIPWASLCYGVAVIGVVLIFVHWFLQGRRRYTGMQFYLVVTFAFGALGLPFASALAAEAEAELGLMMLPAYMMMGLAMIVFVIIQVSPRPDPEPEKPLVPIEELSEKAMRTLMRERSDAINKLWIQGRLPGVSLKMLKQLKARPLGRLHIESDAGVSGD